MISMEMEVEGCFFMYDFNMYLPVKTATLTQTLHTLTICVLQVKYKV